MINIRSSVNRRQILRGTSALAATALVGLPTVARAEETFRIGALNGVTGAFGPFGTLVQKTINLVAKEINELGGPAGLKFEVFSEDTQSLPEPALLAAKKLMEVNNVRALLGIQTSPETLAVLPASNAADVIICHTGSAPNILKENVKGLAFGFYPMSAWIGRAYVDFITKQGFKNPLSLVLTNDSSIANAGAFTEQWAAKHGTPARSLQYQPNQPSYRAEIQEALSNDPDIIILHGYEFDSTIIVRQLYEVGYTGALIAPEFAITSRLISSIGNDAVEGVYVLRFIANRESPTYKVFEDFVAKSGDETLGSSIYSAIAFDQVNLLALAIEKAGANAGAAEIAAAIQVVSNPGDGIPTVSSFEEGRDKLRAGAARINYDGASGPTDFDEKGTTPANFSISVIKDGVIQAL